MLLPPPPPPATTTKNLDHSHHTQHSCKKLNAFKNHDLHLFKQFQRHVECKVSLSPSASYKLSGVILRQRLLLFHPRAVF